MQGAGSLREAGCPKGVGTGRNGKKFATLAQYFEIGKAHRGGNCYGRGRKPGVQGAGGGKFRSPVSPTTLHTCAHTSTKSKPQVRKCMILVFVFSQPALRFKLQGVFEVFL